MPSQVATTVQAVKVEVIEERVTVEVHDDTGKAATIAGEPATVVEVGVPGLPGTGVDGKSAYEVAVANGFIGTEAEWLASLAGAGGFDPAVAWEFYEDFGAGAGFNSVLTLGDLTRTFSGGGGIVTQPGGASGAGYIVTRTGTGSTSGHGIHTQLNAIAETGNTIDFNFKGSLFSLSDDINAFTTWFGIANLFHGAPSYGYYFRYTHSVNGGRFEAVRRELSGPVENAVDTGVTVVAGVDHHLRIVVSADRSSAAFYIDGAGVADIATPVLAASRVCGFGFGAAKSAGATAIDTIAADLIHCKLTFATPRY